MLSGVKFISRDQIDTEKGGELENSRKESRKSSRKKEKSRSKKRSARYSSSDDERLEKIKKGSKKKKWYSSEEYSDSSSADDDSQDSFEDDEELKRSKKKSKRSKRKYSSDDSSESDKDDVRGGRKSSKGKNKVLNDDDGAGGIDIVRKEMGLEWMLRPGDRPKKNIEPTDEPQPEEPPSEEKVNPKELNPYLRNNGSGYPEEVSESKSKSDQLLSSSVVGDGGASWRLKALKRAQEQAEREGRNLEEVAQERWGSLGHLAVSVTNRNAAAPRAHLHAIRSRKMGASEEVKSDSSNQQKRDVEKEIPGREYLKDVSVGRPAMRAPKVHDSLSWGRRKGQNMHNKDAELISKAVSGINKFADDGNFLNKFINQHDKAERGSHEVSSSKSEGIRESESSLAEKKSSEKEKPMSANQLAAKAMQLRLKGKHEEAEKLLKEAEIAKVEQDKGERLTKLRNDVSASRYVTQDIKMRQKGKEDDSDMHLAQSITKNKLYSMSTQADDEYDGAPARKSKKKRAELDNRADTRQHVAKRILTQQERCVFCFENPKRPKHLVVAIANFTYLMLPQYQPLAPGHCCIVTLQHESATRMVDDNVWEEIRNFKKCLIMMFAQQDKEIIFLETVMGLAQQRRHCLIECIPLPQEIAKEAPLYFKKAIDEAEDEWSQHNAKKLIDTSQKGLRSSIPKNFPYFHVEFGLNRGFVHVIDDETQFKSSLGLNVVRGMLQTQDENMYRRRRYESIEVQKEAVAAFAKDWKPFDWTKQLD